jgi:mono/diheme cytochrome c family protein
MTGAGRMRSRLPAILAVASVAFAGAASAQTRESGNGKGLARTLCSACHSIDASADVPSPNPDAPPFAQLAKMPSMNDLAIRVFLRSPHPSMPNFLLSEPEIDGVIAFIRTLGSP